MSRPEFRLEADNDVSFHVAMNAVKLRRYRNESQQFVAQNMGTSQSKVARIEGGDENITLRTLRRLAGSLRGRIRISIEPAEVCLPRLDPWWEMVANGLPSNATWTSAAMFVGVAPADPAMIGWVAAWRGQLAVASDYLTEGGDEV